MPRLLALVLSLLVASSSALAQDGSADGDVSRARVHFEAGIQHYDDGHFEDAAREFEAAFQLTGHPDVLYNLAQSYDRLERYGEAIANYRRYLSESATDSPERGRVERRVRELETLRSAQQADEVEPEEPAEPEPPVIAPSEPEEVGGLGPLPFITMGVGAASIVAAVAFGIAAAGIYSDLEDRCGPDGRCPGFDPTDDASRGSTFATLADVLGIAGGVVLGAGIVLLAIDLGSGSSGEAEDASSATLELTSGPTPLGAGARVRF